jgi:hypothetical protein
MNVPIKFIALTSCITLLALGGCHSPVVNATIVNQSGAQVQLVELDYPSASYGVSLLDAGASYPYHFEVHGSGKLHISFQDAGGGAHQSDGPQLKEGDQGTLRVTIGAGDTVQWQR